MVRFQRTIRTLAAIMLALALVGLSYPKKVEAKFRHRHILRHGRKHHRGHANFSAKAMERNRQMAIEFLRQNSPALSKLVDLPPTSGANQDTALAAEVMSQYEYDDPRDDGADDNESIDTSDNAIQGPEDAAELERYDDVKVDVNEFKKEWLSYIEDSTKSSSQNASSSDRDRINKKQLLATVIDWLGTRYYYGGTTRKGIDCSAFTRMVFDSTCNVALPRSAQEQYLNGTPVDRDDLKFGDLIFFHTRRHPYVSHVGIYLGDNLFTHSSSHYGVTISSLESTYYSEHFIEGRRVVPEATTASNLQPVENTDNTR